MNTSPRKWYRRLQVQMWLWAIIPLTMALVIIAFANVYSHQRAMRDFVWERDLAMAHLFARRIEDALGHGAVELDGAGLSLLVGDTPVGRASLVYVVDRTGRAVFHPDPDRIGIDLSSDPAVQTSLQALAGSTTGRLEDGSDTLAAFSTVGETGWRVIVEDKVSDVIVPILRLSGTIPILIPVAILLSLVLIWFSFRTIVRPLQALAEAAGHTSGGEFEGLEVDVGGVEEIIELQTALKQMMTRIKSYQASIHDYIEGITASQEGERARLSRELHDQTVQDMIAISQRLQLVQRALETADIQEALDVLGHARRLVHETLEELRRLIQALRPAYLEDLGFLPAIETLTAEASRHGIAVETLVRGDPERLPSDVELAAFRVIQEALQNAVQHAHAQQIVISVQFEPHALSISVEDDGHGFTVETTPDVLTRTGHFGLTGMRERALLAGGRLEIQSDLGEGTRVSAVLPHVSPRS